MSRFLPWILTAVALAATLVLGLPLLLDGPVEEGGPGPDELGPGRGEDAAPVSLVGTPGARPPTARAEDTEGFAVTGEVLDAESRPVAGVRVVARRMPWLP